MSFVVDHMVMLVHDLQAAVAGYEALGFTVVAGGEHTDGASHNALIAFADGSYIELLAFKRPAPEHRWWRHTAVGEGLIDYALLPSAISDDIAAARQRGLALNGPIDGGRLRPDGKALAWQIGLPTTPDLPFLCADVTPRALRVPEGAAHSHRNGIVGIANITVAVHDLAQSQARYTALLGIEPVPTPSTAALQDATTLDFSLGSTTITLTAPTPHIPAEHPLQMRLTHRGEGPYALALRSPNRANAADFDSSMTHGVLITHAP
jgi:catechol 2,3-dioxygenase-like lactoylglutathione lyase family enzyme